MTAEIAILNQAGVALAADSAVTISLPNDDKKIYNTANKLFMLSKYHPVGIMIYNSSKVNGIDWEVIIKDFTLKIYPVKTKYIKVVGKSNMMCPEWHKGRGNELFIFTDEITIK